MIECSPPKLGEFEEEYMDGTMDDLERSKIMAKHSRLLSCRHGPLNIESLDTTFNARQLPLFSTPPSPTL